jgi:hypothetical protein
MTAADDRETTVARLIYRQNWYYPQPAMRCSVRELLPCIIVYIV